MLLEMQQVGALGLMWNSHWHDDDPLAKSMLEATQNMVRLSNQILTAEGGLPTSCGEGTYSGWLGTVQWIITACRGAF
jgi:hypothetical protein